MGLIKPAWMYDKSFVSSEKDRKALEKAIKYVESINDVKKLIEVIENAPSWDVRTAAVNQIADQSLLSQLAVKGSDHGIRITALKNLNDQSIISSIATTDSDESVREVAVNMLSDQKILAYIVKNDQNANVRLAAADNISNQTLIVDILKSEKDFRVKSVLNKKRLEWANSETDQAVLSSIAKNNRETPDVQRVIIEKMTDQDALLYVADNYKSTADSFNFNCRRMQAAEKVTDQNLVQSVYADVIMDPACYTLREKAFEKLFDNCLLGAIAKNYSEGSVHGHTRFLDEINVRSRAIQSINDKSLLEKIINDASLTYTLNTHDTSDPDMVYKTGDSKVVDLRKIAQERLKEL